MSTALCDPREWADAPVLHDLAAVQARIPQRHEFALLHGIVHFDREALLGIGIHQTTDQDFWVRGHLPGRPVMPGVVIVEAAAQLCAWVCSFAIPPGPGSFLAFAGIDNARFRGQVVPGDKLILAANVSRLRRSMATFTAQAWVGENLVFEADIIGMIV